MKAKCFLVREGRGCRMHNRVFSILLNVIYMSAVLQPRCDKPHIMHSWEQGGEQIQLSTGGPDGEPKTFTKIGL